MTKFRLTRGADIADMRDYPEFAKTASRTVDLPDGSTAPAYVFHALESTGGGTNPALRGMAVEVPSAAAALQLQTHPTLLFEEVTAEQAEKDRWLRTLYRNGLGQWVDPANGSVVTDLATAETPAHFAPATPPTGREDGGTDVVGAETPAETPAARTTTRK